MIYLTYISTSFLLTFNVLVKKESKYGDKSAVIFTTKPKSVLEDKQDNSVTIDLTVKTMNPASIFGML